MSFLEQVCLMSFVDHWHHAVLFTHDCVSNVPEGVEIWDASLVFPTDDMIAHDPTGSLALTSDVFRYRMLALQRFFWVNAGVFCLQLWKFESPNRFGWDDPSRLEGSVLTSLPPVSKALLELDTFCRDEYPATSWMHLRFRKELQELTAAGRPMHVCETKWGVWGPVALTHFPKQSGQRFFAGAQRAFFSAQFRDRKRLLKPGYQLEQELGKEYFGVHLWNRRLRVWVIDAHSCIPQPESFVGQMLIRHAVALSEAPQKNILPRYIRKIEEAERMAKIDLQVL